MELIPSLLQQMSVFLVIAYLFCKTPIFKPLATFSIRLPHRLVIYLVFSGFCILGTYFGQQLHDAIANTRAIGAVLGGLVGGPVIGLLVGLTGGLHRYTLGGFTDLACAISTTSEGLLAGLVHLYFQRRQRLDTVFTPEVAFSVTLVAEIMQMALILLIATPTEQAWSLVRQIALPMMLANSTGAALFMSMIRDQKRMFDKISSAFAAKALIIADRTVGIMAAGFTPTNAKRIARVVYEETGVGAVAITDRHQVLAFIGLGADHHLPGTPITSTLTQQAIGRNQVMFADGIDTPYRCEHPGCKLGSALVIPLRNEQQVIGTIKLYEPRNKLFLNFNRALGEGIAKLLSSQILAGRYQQQQALLTQSELQLLQAQINPHFLFNTLNTIIAVVRQNPDRARELLQHLSHFFRKNLKRDSDMSSLKEELAHVDAYLEIEKARFADRLQVQFRIPTTLLGLRLPTFTLQPIIENAIKHGVSQLLEPGRLIIAAEERNDGVHLSVRDNAGNYRAGEGHGGLGMSLVDKRIKNRYGNHYGISVDCQPEHYTQINIHLPKQEQAS